jgi:zinc transport system substrate-binding protein
MLKRSCAPCLLVWALLLYSVAGQAQPGVVTSIKPLQLIAAAVMDGVVQPAVLIPSNQSPHHYVLRPSDVALVERADLVIWVGEPLETYLTTLVASVGPESVVIEAASLSGVRLQAPGGDPLAIGETRYDTHLWLNSANALLIAEALMAELVARDATNAPAYRANLENFRELLTRTREQLQERLAPFAAIDYAVFHDGIAYFEREFGLQHQLVVVPDHENQPGVRHIMLTQQMIQERPPACLLEDINTNPATVSTVLGDLPVKRITIDPLGDSLSPDKQGYALLLTHLADAFDECLPAR